MSTGIILGFFTGNIYGTTQPTKQPSAITRLNYAILSSFIRNQGYSTDDILKIYQDHNIKVGVDLGNSNDSFIRLMPFAFIDDFNKVVEDTNLTNPNLINRDAGLLYVTTLKLILAGRRPRDIFQILQQSAQTVEMRTVLQYIAEGKILDMTPNNIFTAFYAAITPFLHSEGVFQSWTQTVEWITRLGGDQALNAALTGSTTGGVFGSARMFNEPAFRDRQLLLLAQFSSIYEIADKITQRYPSFVTGESRQSFLDYRQTLGEMRTWVHDEKWSMFEADKNFMSVIFPTQVNTELTANQEFLTMMREAFTLMMKFYGLTLFNVTDTDRFVTYFVQGGSERQNYIRIAQILRSLRVFKQLDLYNAFKQFAILAARQYPNIIKSQVRDLWEQA